MLKHGRDGKFYVMCILITILINKWKMRLWLKATIGCHFSIAGPGLNPIYDIINVKEIINHIINV